MEIALLMTVVVAIGAAMDSTAPASGYPIKQQSGLSP
jgi:hypothetical protein